MDQQKKKKKKESVTDGSQQQQQQQQASGDKKVALCICPTAATNDATTTNQGQPDNPPPPKASKTLIAAASSSSNAIAKSGPVALDLGCLNRFVIAHKLLLKETSTAINSLLFEILREVHIVAIIPHQQGDTTTEDEEENEYSEYSEESEEQQQVQQAVVQKPPKFQILRMNRRLAEEARPLLEALQESLRQAKEAFFEAVALECIKVGRERKGPVLLTPEPKLSVDAMACRRHPKTPASEEEVAKKKKKKAATAAAAAKMIQQKKESISSGDDLCLAIRSGGGGGKSSSASSASTFSVNDNLVAEMDRVIAACNTVPLAELDAHLENFLSRRPFYVPLVGEAISPAAGHPVDMAVVRQLVEKKVAESGGAGWSKKDVDELDDASLLSKVLLVNARMRRAKAMIIETRRLQDVVVSGSSASADAQQSEKSAEAARQMNALYKTMTAEFCTQHAPLIAEIEAKLSREAAEKGVSPEAIIRALVEEKLSAQSTQSAQSAAGAGEERSLKKQKTAKNTKDEEAELRALIQQKLVLTEALQEKEEAELERVAAALKREEAQMERAKERMRKVQQAKAACSEQLRAKEEALRLAERQLALKEERLPTPPPSAEVLQQQQQKKVLSSCFGAAAKKGQQVQQPKVKEEGLVADDHHHNHDRSQNRRSHRNQNYMRNFLHFYHHQFQPQQQQQEQQQEQQGQQQQQQPPLPPLLPYPPLSMLAFFVSSHRNIFGTAVCEMGGRLLTAATRREHSAASMRAQLASILAAMDRAFSAASYNLLALLEDTDARLDRMTVEDVPEEYFDVLEEGGGDYGGETTEDESTASARTVSVRSKDDDAEV